MDQRYRVIISLEASADIAAIHSFVSRDSAENAASLVAQMLAAIESLADVPHRTIFQPGRGSTTAVRVLPVNPYMIYFRAFDDHKTVKVLTIRHGARRRPKRFS